MKAVELGNSIGFDERSLAWQVPEVHVGQPLAATACIGQACSALPPPVGPVAPVMGPAVGGTIDHDAVLNALRGLKCNKEYLTAQDRIPMGIAMQLKDLLPKEGLLPFLKQYPNFFEVTLSGQLNRPSIRDGAQQPAVGGGGAGGANEPAVGGQGPPPATVPSFGGSSSSGGPQPAMFPPGKFPPGLEPVVGGTSASSVPASGAAPAVGGPAHIPAGPAAQWSVEDMVAYVDGLSLGHLGPSLKGNGLDGHFFLQCTQADLESIGIGPLHWKKIMAYMPQ